MDTSSRWSPSTVQVSNKKRKRKVKPRNPARTTMHDRTSPKGHTYGEWSDRETEVITCIQYLVCNVIQTETFLYINFYEKRRKHKLNRSPT